ncbi:amidohydrolase [Collinsella sp. AGMB00827]|uniref:Amidohydrolase n=1 Tax=Collinsella ureilytica TaxID=2869515 RepID=A0ABS7MHP9_9ACTN|nr:amidohydrolase [Collinsella urealyticum]MBY4796876.1 amidohydrolase [Collinsella urealyticum]
MAMTHTTTEDLSLLRRFRRDLHRIPELDRNLPKTIAYIEAVLNDLACTVFHPSADTVCAFFQTASDGTDALALRADMDALPIAERTGVSFASEHAGCMHACGHDAHMAMVLAAAMYLDRMVRTKTTLPANVLLVFQPAEETDGGAREVTASGVFDEYRVRAIVGFHVWPDLPAGTIWSRPGALLARASETHVKIAGTPRHIAKTFGLSDAQSSDALLAGAAFVAAAHAGLEELGRQEPCICRFGQFSAGTVINAVAGSATVAGSLRVFSDAMFRKAQEVLAQALRVSCERFGCTGSIDFAEGYPPVINDRGLWEWARGLLGASDQTPALSYLRDPLLIAEDFSFYQQSLPGLFLLLGVGEPVHPCTELLESAEDARIPFASSGLHTETLIFDEVALLPGLRAYQRFIRDGLATFLPSEPVL